MGAFGDLLALSRHPEARRPHFLHRDNEQPEFRPHCFLRKLIITLACDDFWIYIKSSFHGKIALIVQQCKFS